VAYVHFHDLEAIASGHFKAKLHIELLKAGKYFQQFLKDERLAQMLMDLS